MAGITWAHSCSYLQLEDLEDWGTASAGAALFILKGRLGFLTWWQ